MADIIEAMPRTPQNSDTPSEVGGGHNPFTKTSTSTLWSRLALGGVMLVSIFMNFFQLGQNGFGNLYYAAGVRSMLDNWHAFFFVSFDPAGFVTIDKPPLGFWLQVLSAKIFGFTPFSVFLPQALSGVLAVALLYHLVQRHFGKWAGILAALALAVSPISVVTNRNNTIDSTLALVLLLGAWAVMKAAETGRLRWLLVCAALLGLGFNIKMLEAYLVVPAFGVLYLLAAPKRLWTRIGHLALAALLLVVISLAWVVAVDMTPASLRPYVGSTQNNSELSLAIGYNGINRLLGQFGGGGGRPNNVNVNGANTPGNLGSGTPPNGAFGGPPNGTPPAGFGGPGGPGGGFGTGNAGPLRLFVEPLGGQIGWLLPLAILGLLALAWQRRLRLRDDWQQQSLVLWGMWFLTMGVFFSVAGFFHPYYLTEMAPAVAALFGIGLVVMWRDYRRSGWRGWLLPLALVATVAEQIVILNNYPTWSRWLTPVLIVGGVLAVGALLAHRLAPRLQVQALSPRVLLPTLSIGVLVLLIGPAVWAAIPVVQNVSAQLPIAGPSQDGGFGGFGGGGRAGNTNTLLIRYLEANQGNATYLVATASSNTADEIILATNKPVMALGGFTGSDPILTTSQLASLVANGTVRFFLLGGGGFGGGGGQQGSLTNWVTQHCTAVPTSQWQSSTASTNTGGFDRGGASQLYSCVTTH